MSATDNRQNGKPSELPPKVAPETLELRAQPRPVTRLNPRMLAVLAGGLASAVLGAMLWSLQPQQRRNGAEQSELYNVDRIARSEGLEQLPADYSQLPPPVAPEVPQLGRLYLVILGGRSSGRSSRPRATTTAMLALIQLRQSAWPGSKRPRKRLCLRCFSARVVGGQLALKVPVKACLGMHSWPGSTPWRVAPHRPQRHLQISHPRRTDKTRKKRFSVNP